jgi:hypothetical protein
LTNHFRKLIESRYESSHQSHLISRGVAHLAALHLVAIVSRHLINRLRVQEERVRSRRNDFVQPVGTESSRLVFAELVTREEICVRETL